MPNNKRQHYVPQNYLRDFSPDGESIGVFIADQEKCIKKAPINSQAQESYFYGKSLEIEKQLSELECLLAENRRTIFNNQTNKLSLYQREVLYQDMMLQLSRTKQMADLYEEMATANARRMWKHSNNDLIKQYADDYCVKYENPAIGPMMVLLRNLTVCLDLDFKVLINRTPIPFVTSDCPVCIYNQFFEAHGRFHSGLNCKGEQLYYPLSSTFAVIYYDHNIYKTKFRKRHYLEITDVSDVNNLNGLVCVSASKCVYYNPALICEEHMIWTFNHVKGVKKPEYKEVEIPTSEKSSFIIAWNPFPAFRLSLSFLKFQDKAKAIE